MIVEEYKETLAAAFPLNPMPSSDGIINVTIPHDEAVKEMLGETTWCELSSVVIDQLFADLILLSHDSFRYFLPAFLHRAMETRNDHHIELVLDALDPSTEVDPESYSIPIDLSQMITWKAAQVSNLQEFTKQQKSAIAAFLDWAGENISIEISAKTHDYWRQHR